MSHTLPALGQIACLALALVLAVPWMAKLLVHTFTSPRHLVAERGLYRLLGLDPDADQHWRTYASAVLGFSLVSVLALYALARLQGYLPLAFGIESMPADGAFNTAISFVTNTNWQWYAGETAATHVLQASGLTVQNFVSAAVGMSVAAAFARSLSVRVSEKPGSQSSQGSSSALSEGRVGNFWRDLIRCVVRVLLPISVIGALVLVALGVIQNLAGPTEITTLTGGTQTLPGGPVASQEVIKELGTNGGGFYNANSAHPWENPTPLSNLLEIFLLLLIPFSMAWAFGAIVGDKRQGRAVTAVMVILLGIGIAVITAAEMTGSGSAPEAAGGAMEGKETRFGLAASALFAASTTGTSTGAVNAMHDSFTAAGGGMAMFSMLLGEIAPGGVGSGLYGMLMLAVVTVFLSGLMVGRTPEYLGRKIGQGEIVLVAAYILVVPVLVLGGVALAVSFDAGLAGLQEEGPHGLSEILYALTSASNNNGSAFAGLTTGTPFWNGLLGICMLLGRFLPMLLVLALAGRFASAPRMEPGPGTLPTHTPLFVGLLTGVALVVVGLTFVPVLVLGPLVESLS